MAGYRSKRQRSGKLSIFPTNIYSASSGPNGYDEWVRHHDVCREYINLDSTHGYKRKALVPFCPCPCHTAKRRLRVERE